MADQNTPAVDNVEAALAAFGSYGDPQTVLAEAVVLHQANHVSDLSIASYALMKRWAMILGRESLMTQANYIQRMSAYAGSPRDAIDMAKSLSLFDFLKGVNIMASGGK